MSEDYQPDRDPPLISYMRLVRAPNLFTAMADSAMGFLFVNATWAWRDAKFSSLNLPGYLVLGLILTASILLYAAGVVLNDVFDYHLDLDERPDRPLPAGDISLRMARMLGWNMLSFGVMLTFGVAWLLANYPPHAHNYNATIITLRPALVGFALAFMIVAYNAVLKRMVIGPLALGPLGMGTCRMLNVLLGMSVLRQSWGPEHYLVSGAIGLYVLGITWFARDEAKRSRRVQLIGAMLAMLTGVAMLGALPNVTTHLLPHIVADPTSWYFPVAMLAVFVGLRCLWAIAQPSPGRVRMVVTQSIMALVVLDASACYTTRGRIYAIAILLLLIPGWILSRKIAST